MPRKKSADTTDDKSEVNTRRLETLADEAAGVAQARQWQMRRNGLSDQGPPSEVRSLSDDADARTQAEAAMRLIMETSTKKPRRR